MVKETKDTVLASANTAAKVLGISTTGLNKWIEYNDFKKEPHGTPNVDLQKLVAAREAALLENSQPSESDSARKAKADADLKEVKAQQEQIHLMEMLGELIPKDMVQEHMETMATEIRQELLALPARLKTKVFPTDPAVAEAVRGWADEEIRNSLRRLGEGADTGAKEEVEMEP